MSKIILLVLALMSASVHAQTDSLSLKFSEEAHPQVLDKNVKWIPTRSRAYNFDTIHSMLKLGAIPFGSTGYGGINLLRQLEIGLGYEQKIPATQFSIEANVNTIVSLGRERRNNIYYHSEYNSQGRTTSNSYTTVYASTDLITRYYFLKRRSIRKNRGGDNLYGVYVYGQASNLLSWQENITSTSNSNPYIREPYSVVKSRGLGSNALFFSEGIGYQQKILKRGYIDAKIGLWYHRKGYRYTFMQNPTFEISFGYSILNKK
tara:strand:+ start:148 stop:933 length:786 start_codon:yes stop_codon:yes gene_type:complete